MIILVTEQKAAQYTVENTHAPQVSLWVDR
jgi:hypothetical protein